MLFSKIVFLLLLIHTETGNRTQKYYFTERINDVCNNILLEIDKKELK